mmetsp:Transcript_7129/g.13507  ORF Transcript_7129/g.13507 Transcript_7129/m.13507 type:complete len:269 (-) Transcript_7129:52-858(-)
MFTALENSLDPRFKSEHMLHDESEYTVQGTKIAALYLLRIFKKCEIGTSATIALIRSDLQNLDKLITECKSDIRTFNSKVKTMVQKLRCYGEPVHDLIHSLFKAYDAVKDSEFVRTIRDERKAFILGQRKDLTTDGLAESLYNIYVEDKSWMQHTDHLEQIVALQAEIKTLKSNRGTFPAPATKRIQTGTEAMGKTAGRARIVLKRATRYWCPNHRRGKGLWSLHKPDDCRNKDKDKNDADDEETENSGRDSVTAALALLEGDGSDDE